MPGRGLAEKRFPRLMRSATLVISRLALIVGLLNMSDTVSGCAVIVCALIALVIVGLIAYVSSTEVILGEGVSVTPVSPRLSSVVTLGSTRDGSAPPAYVAEAETS